MMKKTTLLPHQAKHLFLTDGGLETTLIFLEGFELPCFAAFDLLKNEQGYVAISNYYRRYLKIAKDFGTGFILESPTWRANPDWIIKLGYPITELASVNEKAIQLLVDLKSEFENEFSNILISGCIGPRGDGYKPGNIMTAEAAHVYHSEQIEALSRTPVNMITAVTMNYIDEAIGIVRACNAVNLPVVISFTVETDGKLADGTALRDAIERVDKNVKEPPIYYMINCAHPSHFINELQDGREEPWIQRIKGVRANASCKSHAELDESTTLDRGNPAEFGIEHQRLKNSFTQLTVFGGCCGTDEAHLLEIARQITIA